MTGLVVDLFCGLGGWAEGFLAEGFEVVGFDIERHVYGEMRYPATLVLQDVLTLHGSQFRDAVGIVASPPCQAYSYRAMPWKRAKALPPPDNTLFEACFRIQREACEAAGRHIPMVVENVKGAQPWVGRAKWHYGSYYLWGDVPVLMPPTQALKRSDRNFHVFEQTGLSSPSFNGGAHEHRHTKNQGGVANNTTSGYSRNPVNGTKTVGHVNKRDGYGHTRHLTNQREHDAVKQHLSGPAWFDGGRKAASAMIAKIPYPLANWIARCWRNGAAK